MNLKKNMKSKEKTASLSLYSLFANVSYWFGMFVSIFAALGVVIDPSIFSWDFVVGYSFGGLLPLGVGSAMKKKLKKSRTSDAMVDLERIALKALSKQKGVITVAQLSVVSGLTLEESQAAIDHLLSKSVVYPEITENGTVVYNCEEFK